ncbi:MAG TPA: hypothetical protein VK993_01425 [Chthoniobacterales bacterium]|nr:hypothetical protein [Chthoniobacterales bacterium]
MFTPLEEAGISPLANESTVSPALASSIGDQRDLYPFPTAGTLYELDRLKLSFPAARKTPTSLAHAIRE